MKTSLQWLLSCSYTRLYDIVYVHGRYVCLSLDGVKRELNSMLNHKLRSYVPANAAALNDSGSMIISFLTSFAS